MKLLLIVVVLLLSSLKVFNELQMTKAYVRQAVALERIAIAAESK